MRKGLEFCIYPSLMKEKLNGKFHANNNGGVLDEFTITKPVESGL